MNNLKNDDLIEKYFDKNLSNSERITFERKMEGDPEFAEALLFRQELKACFQYETKVKKLNRTMDRVENELELKDKLKEINWYKKLSVAASTLLLIGLGFAANQFKQHEGELAMLANEKMILQEELCNNVEAISNIEYASTTKEVFYKEKLEKNDAEVSKLNTIKQQQAENNNKQLLAYQNLQKQAQNSSKELEKFKAIQEEQAQSMAALNLANIALKEENEFWKSPERIAKMNKAVEELLGESVAFREPRMRGNKGMDVLLRTGVEKYKAENYEEAVTDFDKFLEQNPDDDEVLFYKGICYKHQSPDNYPRIILIFEQLLNKENGHAKEDELQWQLALLYTKTGQYKKAKNKLEKIVGITAPAHRKKVDAEALLSYF